MTIGYRTEPANLTEAQARYIADQQIANAIRSQGIMGQIAPGSLPHAALQTGYQRVRYSPDSAGNYTISATAATEVDSTNLSGTILCSGTAPVRLDFRIRGLEVAATGGLYLGFTWDGEAVEADGIWSTASTVARGASSWTLIESPRPGLRRFALCAHRATANGTIYSGAGNSIELFAKEV